MHPVQSTEATTSEPPFSPDVSRLEKALTDNSTGITGRGAQNEAADSNTFQLAMLTLGLCLCTLIVSLDTSILGMCPEI